MSYPKILDPNFKAMLDAEAAATPPDMPPLHELPPEMVRAAYREQRTGQNAATSPANVETRDLNVAGHVPARLYVPEGNSPPSPLLVYFHGGGWVIGDLETHDAHCRRLAVFSGARVMAVDYRLAPEHPFPAGHDDALNATKWAFDHADEIGADRNRIGVGGDSAGGNLAATVSQDLKGDAAYPLKFQLLIYPATGPEPRTRSRQERDGPLLTTAVMDWFEKLLGAHAHPHGHRAMPARASDLSGLPPALVITAGHDPLEDEGRDYAEALKAAGVPARVRNYEDMVHDFFIMGDVSPGVVDAAKETGESIRGALA